VDGERRDQILHNRLLIGHTCLTNFYLIVHTDSKMHCHQLLSVKHILAEYGWDMGMVEVGTAYSGWSGAHPDGRCVCLC